jgi:hypothetical protein
VRLGNMMARHDWRVGSIRLLACALHSAQTGTCLCLSAREWKQHLRAREVNRSRSAVAGLLVRFRPLQEDHAVIGMCRHQLSEQLLAAGCPNAL